MAAQPPGPPPPGLPPDDPRLQACLRRYWRRNLRVMLLLLGIWAIAGLGCGVLWADWLDRFRLGGFPLGFWFAQQGSIVVFVLLILVYAIWMRALDRRHHDELQQLQAAADDDADAAAAAGEPRP